MWAEANNYWYHGRKVASVKGGSLYTAPELVLLEEPEPDGKPLIPVNIPLMVAKNHTILEALVQDTIKKVFNIYVSYRKKVDIFYVAFSGGKDSVVALDIVQRALPHNEFKVVFGNTDMEFPTTTELVQKLSRKCSDEGIEFLEAASNMTSKESWNIFGPPARKVRWCCTVHKTAPVINMLTSFGELITRMGTSDANSWALMLCNLAYTPAFQWYIKNIPFNETYYERQLDIDMGEDTTKKAKSEFWNGFKTILDTNEAFKEIGLGIPDITVKQTTAGEKKSMNSLVRQPWQDPDPRVILYSLYKFAEACGDYYDFTLTRLLDFNIDSAGISPAQIFGLNREIIEPILNGLSINYPNYIKASFTLDLDNITLNRTKKSKDILELF